MKLKEYAKKIAILSRAFPNAKVIYSSDDEGNRFAEVHYSPTQGIFTKDGYEGEFKDTEKSNEVNAICLN